MVMWKHDRTLGIVLCLAATAAIPTACAGTEQPVFDPVSYRAKPDGKTLCTAAIQKAIDQCAAAGGGTVALAGGKFLSGGICLKSNVTLRVDEGATLLGSPNLADYPVTIPAYRSYTDNYTERSLIYGENLENIAITGKGTIDGQGKCYVGQPERKRPYCIRLIACRNVHVESVTMRNSAMWMQHYLACDNLSVRGLNIWNHAGYNNDMIDLDGCRRVRIENCTSDTDDDGLTFKGTSNRDSEDVTVSNCVIRTHCNAIKFGTETIGGFKRISIRNCVVKPSVVGKTMFGCHGLAGIALEIVDGGVMEDIAISGIRIEGTLTPLFVRLGDRGRTCKKGSPKPPVGRMQHFHLGRNRQLTSACWDRRSPESRAIRLRT